MKEETLNAIENFMVDLMQDVDKLKDFSVEQAPDICKQLLSYTLVTDYVFLAFFTLAGGALLLFAGYIAKRQLSDSRMIEDTADGTFACFTSAAIGLILPIPSWCILLPEILQIHIAPKLFLLEYAKDLL